VRWEEAVSGCRRSDRFPTETPGMAGSRSLGIRVGCRLGLVRRRTAQHVSALHTASARVLRTVRFVPGCGKEDERNGTYQEITRWTEPLRPRFSMPPLLHIMSWSPLLWTTHSAGSPAMHCFSSASGLVRGRKGCSEIPQGESSRRRLPWRDRLVPSAVPC
jgi:hypothetical protein